MDKEVRRQALIQFISAYYNQVYPDVGLQEVMLDLLEYSAINDIDINQTLFDAEAERASILAYDRIEAEAASSDEDED